ncbi:pyruvate/2-oxoglutarate dehydrogenase complex dihydrolipoamide dehydrogenase (E3) component [Nocardioides marinisabuli]|uniref:Pyruvate/2-oxoglutarate dehydrogenase complex dihydrolipoamide dehydrogenase (E3) component n=1 Tax=Nocardioides marinisabuli TaxID=419476 RepID=A0A7Y9JSR5_9ACTN|nr:NAD(P)/FAD-dependent oxidoreductase [Nocardioides marinisabuli]NYD58823.1 pyruvate/2-oxoglutarate dehydrogenase complex dihydrolipoamide dehydrogenase (E3) component [Nocardioides marinisabuli]
MSEQQSTDVDLVVVGLGPGAESLATGAAAAGLRVVAVDKHLVGGECPYYGCVPSKMMLRAADSLAEARRVSQLSGEAQVVPSWAPVARRISEEATSGWDDQIAVQRLEDAGVTFHHGVGRLDGPGRVVVTLPDGATRAYEAARGVVLNPGTRPAELPIEGLAGTPYWTNREAVQATELPGSLIVVGGGPIGAEMAQVFQRFGVRVTLLEAGPRILGPDEPEAAQVLEEVFVEEGMRVMTGVEITSVSHADGGFEITLGSGDTLRADKLLLAAGRTPNLDDIGLETVGLDPQARTVEVDEHLRAGERLWVIGDVTGKGAFTHVAMYQSAIALRDITGQDGPPAQYHAVPHTTFTDPEVGGVGLTEEQAREAGLRVRVGTAPMESSSRGWLHGPGGRGLVKVVEDADRGVLVGATAMGPSGGEVLGFLAVAVHAEVPVETLQQMIYAYPTFHRTIETALGALEETR